MTRRSCCRASSRPSARDEAAPAPIGVIAHYNLLERLEASGPGDLFRARDTKLGRTVAVRLLPKDFTADRQRPDRRARAA